LLALPGQQRDLHLGRRLLQRQLHPSKLARVLLRGWRLPINCGSVGELAVHPPSGAAEGRRRLRRVLTEIIEATRQIPQEPQQHLHRFRLNVPA
jgi:hypothetical protein